MFTTVQLDPSPSAPAGPALKGKPQGSLSNTCKTSWGWLGKRLWSRRRRFKTVAAAFRFGRMRLGGH